MALKDYFIRCYNNDCPREAVYKIASRWSDGVISELKTYFLCCAECLPPCFHEARRKQAVCRLVADETLEAPGIYLIQRGSHDYELQRLKERETELLQVAPDSSP